LASVKLSTDEAIWCDWRLVRLFAHHLQGGEMPMAKGKLPFWPLAI
jgi:hypothetical protein